MQHGAAPLNPAVMAATGDFSVDHQHRADGDAPFGQTQPRFFDGCLQERIHRRFASLVG